MNYGDDKEITFMTDALKNFAKEITRACTIVNATVTGVDETLWTCSITTANGNFSNVPLSVLKNSQGGFIIVPAINSDCLISFKTNDANRPQLLMVDQVDKLLITANTISFNSGTKGIPVSLDLVTRFNNLENLVNDLVSKFNSHTHPASSGTTSPTLTPETGSATLTVLSDIASIKVFNDN